MTSSVTEVSPFQAWLANNPNLLKTLNNRRIWALILVIKDCFSHSATGVTHMWRRLVVVRQRRFSSLGKLNGKS
jgi:hypothetical protein